MVKIAICGGSGYTGLELLRILAGHPDVEVSAVTSEKSAGKRLAGLFPHLQKYGDLTYERLNKETLLKKAARLTGITAKTALVHLGLEALIARESARRLAKLGGTDKNLRPIRRRRSGSGE